MITIFERIALSKEKLAILKFVEENAAHIIYSHGAAYKGKGTVYTSDLLAIFTPQLLLDVNFTEYPESRKKSVSYSFECTQTKRCSQCEKSPCLLSNGQIAGKDTRFARHLYDKMMHYYIALNGQPTY